MKKSRDEKINEDEEFIPHVTRNSINELEKLFEKQLKEREELMA